MRLLFFQNCVSPHQMPYIEALAQRHKVTVIVPFIAYQEREMMGWGKYEANSAVQILVSPTQAEVQALFEEKYNGRSVAFFSGISAFKEVKAWFRCSLDYPVERGVITEAPYTFRYPLWMHKLRFILQDYRYIKYVDYMFAIGRKCEEYYRIWSGSWKIVPFDYCVAPRPVGEPLPLVEPGKATFCFVGSLDRRKNVKTILEAFTIFQHKHRAACRQCQLIIVGDGPKRAELEQYVQQYSLDDVVTFAGTLPMASARQVIAQSHVLILPSLYDGWGAVVNEALMEGTMVYCSDQCGASCLIDSPSRGRVFAPRDTKTLSKYLWNDYGFCLDEKKAQHRREALRQWALDTIGPEAIARRMEAALVRRRGKKAADSQE